MKLLYHPETSGRAPAPPEKRWFVKWSAAWVLAAGLNMTLPAGAWQSPAPLTPVPDHASAWIETYTPDMFTLLLWKFSTAGDAAMDVDALLDMDFDALANTLATTAGPALADGLREPRLHGNARVVANAGYFGGGLILDGNGYAEATLSLRSLIDQHQGFTVDFWFRADAPGSDTQTLFALHDPAGRLLIAAHDKAGTGVVIEALGKQRLAVPLHDGRGSWHHLVFAARADQRGSLNEITLQVDHTIRRDPYPDDYDGLIPRHGGILTVGGAPGHQGLHGAVDEVRLQRGRRYFYPIQWHTQQHADTVPIAPVAPPYFRSDAVSLLLPFDGSLEPERFEGTRWQGRAAPHHFQPGIRGQALDLRRIEEANFALDGMDLFPGFRGTVEFWMRPLDWNNFFEYDHVRGGRRDPVTFAALRPPDALRYGRDRPAVPTQRIMALDFRYGAARLHPGAWTHVVIVIDGRHDGHFGLARGTHYINGERQSGPIGASFSDSLRGNARRPNDRFGPGELRFESSGTLIDEFSVYPWVMNDDEAWNAYARWLPDGESRLHRIPATSIRFAYLAHTLAGHQQLHVHAGFLPIDGTRPATVAMDLHDRQGGRIRAMEPQPTDVTGQTTFRVRFDDELPFGHYTATFRAFDAGGALIATEQANYERVRPAWYRNSLGMVRSVPAPWTPMQVAGHTLRLWGRELELGPNGLPAGLTTLDIPVLAAPAGITVTGPAGPAKLNGQDLVFTETAGDRVAWRATLTGGGIRAMLDAWMEFDGLLYCTITLHPGDTDRIESLHIDFPMNAGHVQQLLANGGGANFRNSWVARFIPDGEGLVWDGLSGPPAGFGRALPNFLPHVWLGGDVAGLYFGGDNDKGWTVDGPVPAQEIRRSGEFVTYRMNIIREPTALPSEGRRFHFALLPTPAKPAPEDWRQRMRGGYGSVRYWFGAMDVFGGVSLNEDPHNPGGNHSALEPVCWDHAMVESARLREKEGMTILMANASYPGLRKGFRDWNNEMWHGTGRVAWTPELEDYAVWAMNEYLRRDVIDGIYIDDVSIGRTHSLASTAYDLEDGTRRTGFTALAQRRFLMRLWRLFLEHDKVPDIGLHMTYSYEIPMFSFARYLYNGEIFETADRDADRSFMDIWFPNLLRVLSGSVKWGAGQQWVTPISESADAHWAYTQHRAAQGNFLVADVLSEFVPENTHVENGLLAPGVRVYPSWKADEVLRMGGPDGVYIVAAVYAHADRAFVVVTNYERDEQTVTLDVDTARLFPGAPRELVWRDADPGLKPPHRRVAGRDELRTLAESRSPDALFGTVDVPDADSLADWLEDTSPEDRDMQRWRFDPAARPVSAVIRPYDYRILEVRPVSH